MSQTNFSSFRAPKLSIPTNQKNQWYITLWVQDPSNNSKYTRVKKMDDINTFQSYKERMKRAKYTNLGKLYLPDFNQNLTFEVLDIKVNQGDGYSINTLELDSNNFISVLNVYKESGLWILWGTKGEQELIIFQSVK